MSKPIGSIVLVILAILAGLYGLASLSQATLGVGIICGGCLLAIFARIAQAAQQHKALKQAVAERHGPPNS